jgi:tetratricopeptide (TPR) repeat protein
MDTHTVITLTIVGCITLIVVVLVLAGKMHRFKIDVKSKDSAVTIDASKTPDTPHAPTHPNINTQNNVSRNQYNAQQDITHIEGDAIQGDKIAGDKITNINQIVTTTPPSPLHQISEPVRDFVGRKNDIEKVLAGFAAAKPGAVISGLHGMGGVGKTELAKNVARQLKDRFPDAQIAYDLRGASDSPDAKPATPIEALQHIIFSFNRDEKNLPEELSKLVGLCHSCLDKKKVLVLMDNARDAAQVGPVADALPAGCGLLVTSRNRFTLAGMQPVDIDTMSPDEARQLLLEICSRIGSDADALAEQCGRLPLALRLAASALLVHEYINDLGDEKNRLAKLDRYKDQTSVPLGVEASLEISYRLLADDLQRRWRALGVFPGSFDAEAASAVWEVEKSDAETSLENLHAASMVLWDAQTGRYRLHDLARVFARGKRTDEERDADAQRHAEHYLAMLGFSDKIFLEGGEKMKQGLALFDREWENIEAGWEWAKSRMETDDSAARLCSDYPDAGVYCLGLRQHPKDRVVWLEVALEAARKLEDRQAEGAHLGNLGNAYSDLGEVRKAIEFYEQHLAIAREIGDRRGEGADLGNLGSAYYRLGEVRKAIGFYEQYLAIAREIGDRRGEGADLGNLGIAYADLGEVRKAIEYYEQRLDIAREIGDRQGEGNALGNLGNAYSNLGEVRKAIEFYEQALEIAREIGDLLGEGNVLHNLADELSEIGRLDEAIAHAERAAQIFEQIESPHVSQARALLEYLRGLQALINPQK